MPDTIEGKPAARRGCGAFGAAGPGLRRGDVRCSGIINNAPTLVRQRKLDPQLRNGRVDPTLARWVAGTRAYKRTW